MPQSLHKQQRYATANAQQPKRKQHEERHLKAILSQSSHRWKHPCRNIAIALIDHRWDVAYVMAYSRQLSWNLFMIQPKVHNLRWFYPLALFVCFSAVCQTTGSARANHARFYKAECGTAADYLELSTDGTYSVVAREHMGVQVMERGGWHQSGSVITFKPSSRLRGGETTSVSGTSYEGDELEHKGRKFLVFKVEGAAGMVIPATETKQQLDSDPQSLPQYVFFNTSAKVFAHETKQTYPFRYLQPDN